MLPQLAPTRSSRRTLIVNYGKVFLGDTADQERMTLEFVREKVLIADGQTPFEIKGPDGLVVITLSSKTEVGSNKVQHFSTASACRWEVDG